MESKRRKANVGQATAGIWRNIVCVDPGFGGTGLAFWARLEHTGVGAGQAPDRTEQLPHPAKGGWYQRAVELTEAFGAALGSLRADEVVIENQHIWESTAIARAAALRGDIVQLAHLSGMYAHRAECANVRVHWVDVREWKGQMSKGAVHARIRRILDARYPEHIADAVGIGLYLQGAL